MLQYEISLFKIEDTAMRALPMHTCQTQLDPQLKEESTAESHPDLHMKAVTHFNMYLHSHTNIIIKHTMKDLLANILLILHVHFFIQMTLYP